MRLTRTHAARCVAILVVAASALLARQSAYSASERAAEASRFSFQRAGLPSASSEHPRFVRVFQPQLRRIEGWMSSVGAAVALTDADGDARPNDYCLVDPRTDSVTVGPTPGSGSRFEPFLLHPSPLPYDKRTMAPMGCLPGDYDEDGRTDFLTYYWGRTPVLFLGRARRGAVDAAAFERRELVASIQRWFTDTIVTADIDSDGHPDIIVGNYFPDGARVLDARATEDPLMQMQHSMSRAYNGGVNRIYLWSGPGRFREARGALSQKIAKAWTLAAAAADIDGDLRPELYFANDFGPDRLLVNRSTPGRVRLIEVRGKRTLTTPGSKRVGHDSFKGMGADFGDMNGDGRLDLMVSNITSNFALQESNLAFIHNGERLAPGRAAPYDDRSEALGIARSGWSWDVKLGDFDSDGIHEIVQTKGFVKGRVNRWPELHELALGNDELLRHPDAWPRFAHGDDLSGHEHTSFYTRSSGRARYVDIADELGVGWTGAVTRGVATADVDRDGRLDMAIAAQWGQSHLYRNLAQRAGDFLGLDLRLNGAPQARPAATASAAGAARTRPAIGASATVHLPDGRRLVGQVDGGSGHASVRAPELHFGLGRRAPRRLLVKLAWRAPGGEPRSATLRLAPGWHTVLLDGRRST